jgi:putative transposase
MSGISKSQVGRLCEDVDGRVKVFPDRPIEGAWPPPSRGPAKHLGRRHLSQSPPRRPHRLGRGDLAVGVNSDGRREVLGMAIGPSEAEVLWTGFLRSLARRGTPNLR